MKKKRTKYGNPCKSCGGLFGHHYWFCKTKITHHFKPELMNEKTVNEMSSEDLRKYIDWMLSEANKINIKLIGKGQIVASNAMDDAVYGLHKTLSVWNHAITW